MACLGCVPPCALGAARIRCCGRRQLTSTSTSVSRERFSTAAPAVRALGPRARSEMVRATWPNAKGLGAKGLDGGGPCGGLRLEEDLEVIGRAVGEGLLVELLV